MITTVSEFDEETAWEKMTLSLAVPLVALQGSRGGLDLWTKNATIHVSDTLGQERVDELRNSLLPLLFGAAWKILDLGLELAFAMAGFAPARGQKWSIKEKSELARSQSGALQGFSPSSDLWQAIGHLYAGTAETRHALVHRRVQVASGTRDLKGFDARGSALQSLSYDEQMAFCRFAQRLADAIINGALVARAEADLRGQLVILQRHHGVVNLGSLPGGPPIRMTDSLPTTQEVDVPHILGIAKKTFPGTQYVDLELHLDDGRVLVGELESAPKTVVRVDPTSPPSWLHFQ